MMWFNKVTQDLSTLPDFIDYYYNELMVAKTEVKISGIIEKNLSLLPGQVQHRFGQLQDIEAILNHMNIQLRKIQQEEFKKYLEGYNRALTSRDAERYAEGSDSVVDYETLINSVALLRNQYLGIIKAQESKNFMLGHIAKLRTAGMEDIVIEY